MKKVSSLFCVIVIFSSCVPVLKFFYGFKNPQFEKHENIVKFQNEIGFQNIPYLGLKAEMWGRSNILSAPEIFVFNNEGKYIPYKDSLRPNCNGPAEIFLEELNTEKKYYFSDDYNIDSFIGLLEGPECTHTNFNPNKDVDFIIFMTYSIFSGHKLYKEKSELWLDALKQNNNMHYQICMVNLDPKDCWSADQKKIFNSGK